jgi:hypothetical protein
MKGLRVAILLTAAAGLLIFLPEGLAFADPAFTASFVGPNCTDVCGIQWLLVGLLVALIGAAATIAAAVLAGIDAGRRGDWIMVVLVLLQLVLSVGAVVYLVAAVNATTGPGGPSSGAPSTSHAIIAGVVCVLVAPASLVLYGLLGDLTTLHRIVLAALVVLVAIAPLVVAPPWVAFNSSNDAPILSVTAPNTTVNCSQGPFPPITVTNTGSGTLQWTAESVGKSTIVPMTTSPSSGTLGPGMSQMVTLSPSSTTATGAFQAVSVSFASNGGGGSVVYSCQ